MARFFSLLVVVSLAASTATSAWADPVEGSTTSAPKRMPALQKAGWYALVGGGGLIVTSAVFYGLAARDQNEFDRTRRHDAADAYERHLRETKLFGYAGLLAIGAGVTLVLLSPGQSNVRVSSGLSQLSLCGNF